MKHALRLFLLRNILIWFPILLQAQTTIDRPTAFYLLHSSGNMLVKDNEQRAVLQPGTPSSEKLLFIPDGKGYYSIQSADGESYMTLNGSWNTFFEKDSTTQRAKYAIEKVNSFFIKLRCQYNSNYLGTDNSTSGSHVYSDKSGTDARHYWYLTQNPMQEPPVDTLLYVVNPEATRQTFEGWGVSLCWWANMCGKWSDEKIDELVDWLVSPDGLNYHIFRYNIGGGDDPQNRNCTPHHMGEGKGLRAEMEGFKDSSEGEYIWSRDAAQRKIMLKIKEKRPDAIFEAFSNSCPYYMTYSGCCAGNTNASKDNLKPEYYEEFAHYLVDVCKHYKDVYGIEFKTLEPFNEPMTNYWGANGGQEGCHFDVGSQIEFLKVLSPILKASGLKTVISASDETNVGQSVIDFEAYQKADVLNLVGQWNVHTYSGNNIERSKISAWCTQAKMPLWMSEVGAGGSGINGNLNMAQKLIDDIRYIMPEAWLDWQYVEENNDQWCMVTGNFAQQTYRKVKNYTIRQHFSKYIKKGYTFLTTLNNQTLAARTPDGDSLIIVALNTSDQSAQHQVDLSFYQKVSPHITCLHTTSSDDMLPGSEYRLEDKKLYFKMKPRSIATLILQVEEKANPDLALQPDVPYLIIPRNATNQALQASSGKVIIESLQYSPAQIWKLHTDDHTTYRLTNLLEETITAQSPVYHLTSQSANSDRNQYFKILPTDERFYKITTTDESKAFDLEGEKTIPEPASAYGNMVHPQRLAIASGCLYPYRKNTIFPTA